MSDAVQIALIGGLPATIAALAALWVSIRTQTTAKVIEGHVNSAATKASGEIAQLRKEVEMLTKVAAENREIAAMLASRAGVVRQAERVSDRVPDVATQTLKAIEVNTEATAEATAETLKAIESNTAAIDKNTQGAA